MGSIDRWSEAANQKLLMHDFKEIFFSCSSKKDFESNEQKEKFFETWTSPYFQNYSDHILIAIGEKNELQGYLTGCPDSNSDKKLKKLIPSMKLFEKYYEKYPAHLHINCHPNSQGKGIGSKLVEKYIEILTLNNSKGIHIITSPGEKNVSFYQKMGFEKIAEKKWKTADLLLMGKQFSE